MKKYIVAIAALVALAIPTVAMASVNVDASGTGFVGKGDVQTALGYGNGNDKAFQADQPESATFTIDNATDVFIDAKCAKLDGIGFDYSTVHDIVVPLGYYTHDETVITSDPKISNGKVTGYNLTGVVTPGLAAWHVDGSKGSTSCPEGESFYGWGGDTPGLFRYVPRAGNGTLQVTLAGKTAPLPNTPVEISAV